MRTITSLLDRKEEAMDQQIEDRKKEIKSTLRCPHCGSELEKWEVPQHCFTEWPNDHMYICFNDECPYYVRGWQWMWEQNQVTASYRHKYDPVTGEKGPIPVWSPTALKSGIID